jgi:uncharacterized membrane protein YfcA
MDVIHQPPRQRNPLAFFLISFLCLPAGLSIIFGGLAPASIYAALPIWLVYTWAVVLTFCGLLSVISFFMKKSLTNARLTEWVATLPLSFAAAAYAVAIIGYVGGPGLVPALLLTGFACACFARAEQLKNYLQLFTWRGLLKNGLSCLKRPFSMFRKPRNREE